MSRRLRREAGTGLVVLVAVFAGGYWQAERTGAFEGSSARAETLGLACQLH